MCGYLLVKCALTVWVSKAMTMNEYCVESSAFSVDWIGLNGCQVCPSHEFLLKNTFWYVKVFILFLIFFQPIYSICTYLMSIDDWCCRHAFKSISDSSLHIIAFPRELSESNSNNDSLKQYISQRFWEETDCTEPSV